MSRRLIALAVMAGAVVWSLAGCDYVSRKDNAKLLVHAAKRAEQVGTGTGRFAVAVRTSGTLASNPLAAGFVAAIPPVQLDVAFARREAIVSGTPVVNGRALPESVFVGSVVLMKRPVTQADAESQFGFRAWSRLDFSKVGRKQKNVLSSANVVNPINPAYLVRLLAGTLSGSVRRLGTEAVGGVPTTHYRMSVDRAKAFRSLSDKDHQAVDKAFKADNVSGTVYKNAEVWIDRAGLPRRLVLRLKQKVVVGAARDVGVIEVPFILTYTIGLSSFGAPVTISPPGRDQIAEVTTLNALLSSAGAGA